MYTGKDPFTFWFGVVEDRMDPLELGRVRVRILGFHPELRKDFPTEKLPWAQTIQPTQSASLSGKGVAPIGLVEGSWVVGFFVDGMSAQIPIVIGSIYGMNEQLQDGDNYGDGFKDVRESFAKFPVDEFRRRLYPDGRSANGDQHGAQLINERESKAYPRENYSPESSGRDRGTPDLNILAINDPERIDKTIVELKKKKRNSGLRDDPVKVADCKHPVFKAGVIGISGASRPSIKALGGPNPQDSSSFNSRAKDSKQFKDKPTNNNAIRIDSSKVMKKPETLLNLNLNIPIISDIGLA